ncbi:MAG: DUF983 domain-containing protein [Rhizobiaceae bacterium]|nr:DUF983 domain-containing protein [Rhizobiaceae bacterium]
MADRQTYITPDAFQVGLKGCCPRCGQGRLFQGILKPALRCMACGLDYAFIDSGDGPAVFVILIIGFVITALALALQTSLNPPIWLQVILWTPVIIALSIWGLRFAKGIMISLQFQTKAKEGKLGTEND